jgi:predicted PurR-regulated permease PerM
MAGQKQSIWSQPIGHVLVAVAVVVAAAWLAPPVFQVVLVVFAGALLGVFLSQLSGFVARHTRLRFGAAFGVVTIALMIAAGAIVYFLGHRITAQVNLLLEQLNRASGQIDESLQVQEWWRQLTRLNRESLMASQALSTATTAAWSTLALAGSIVSILFLGFYFGLQSRRYRDGFLALFNERLRPRVEEMLDRIVSRLWRWILGRLVGMTVIGVGSTVGLSMFGVPLPMTLKAIS